MIELKNYKYITSSDNILKIKTFFLKQNQVIRFGLNILFSYFSFFIFKKNKLCENTLGFNYSGYKQSLIKNSAEKLFKIKILFIDTVH